MYAGKIVETGSIEDIFYRPLHPYTWGLLSAMPDLNTDDQNYIQFLVHHQTLQKKSKVMHSHHVINMH